MDVQLCLHDSPAWESPTEITLSEPYASLDGDGDIAATIGVAAQVAYAKRDQGVDHASMVYVDEMLVIAWTTVGGANVTAVITPYGEAILDGAVPGWRVSTMAPISPN